MQKLKVGDVVVVVNPMHPRCGRRGILKYPNFFGETGSMFLVEYGSFDWDYVWKEDDTNHVKVEV